MTGSVPTTVDELSLFSLGTIILRRRKRIARWTIVGGVVAALTVIAKPAVYMATASFIPQVSDPARSGLASLAGQFGVSLPGGTQGLTSDFYAQLLKSKGLLRYVAADSFVVIEKGSRRMSFVDLFDVGGATEGIRQARAVEMLTKLVLPSASRTTGIVEVSIATPWPSASAAIASTLVERVNEFNQQTRREQAALERRFVEGRLSVTGADLRSAEDQMQRFLQANRQSGTSPELSFERDRLQRVLTLRQQVFNALTQSYEDVRIREVRDTPIISMVESPVVPVLPEPRGRLLRVVLGLILGGVLSTVLIVISDLMAHRRREDNREASEFVDALSESKEELLSLARRLRRTRQ